MIPGDDWSKEHFMRKYKFFTPLILPNLITGDTMKLDEALQMKNVLENEITALLVEFSKQTGLVASITSEYSRVSDDGLVKHYYEVDAEVKLEWQ